MAGVLRTILRVVLSAGLLAVILAVGLLAFLALLLGIPAVTAVTVGGGLVVVLLAGWGIVRTWRGSGAHAALAGPQPGVGRAGAAGEPATTEEPEGAEDELWTSALAEHRDFSPAELFEFQNALALRNAAGIAAQRGGAAAPTEEDIAGGRASLDAAREKAGTVQRKLAGAMKRWDTEYARTGTKDGPASREVTDLSQMYEFYLREAGELNQLRGWRALTASTAPGPGAP